MTQTELIPIKTIFNYYCNIVLIRNYYLKFVAQTDHHSYLRKSSFFRYISCDFKVNLVTPVISLVMLYSASLISCALFWNTVFMKYPRNTQ